MNKIVIAIDGYSGCGKSSTAKAVAKDLGYTYIDTGAMYRAATLHFLNNYLSSANPNDIAKGLKTLEISFHFNPETQLQEIYLNGLHVDDEIRTMRVSNKVSEIAAIPAIRSELVAQQQRLGKKKGVVMDGRDVGSVVFPDAELKVFMTADLNTRAERRQAELLEKGELVPLEEILENLSSRDRVDSTREVGPLIKVADALEVDTSNITFVEQVAQIVQKAREIIDKENSYAGKH
ncbi:(d)CMP kinase [Algoriphagus halophytocola]|uniref:Cytidylate kinase n=1 Tax=Algoriphagus halophytocola TaxID=2991499 RepID=A0ABY6MF23_9BACT|nr:MULTISPECIES: (d)CMP kinase [unclassified Algoriphagus]UZD20936.1 (d)CMP kinase [Algoriphagus sp. TR-M5]WBL42102.1 (d)CMP kinase [Algoriphagus sp. TR-M9]